MKILKQTIQFRFYLLFFILLAVPLFGHAESNSPLTEGIELYRNGNYDKAREKLYESIKLQPRSAETFYFLGLTYSKLSDNEKAVAAIKKAIQFNPSLPGAHLALGMSFYKLDLNDLAKKEFETELSLDSKNSSAIFFLALNFQKQLQFEKAIHYFQKAANEDADFEQLAWYNIGMCYLDLEKPASAKDAFEHVVKIKPDSHSAQYAREYLSSLSPGVIDKKPWSISVNTGIEYDDNVTIDEVNSAVGIGDYAAVFDLSGYYKVIETQESELEIGYDFYQSVYFELSELDLQSHTFSLTGSHEVNDVDLGLGYSYNFNTLGGDRFFETHSVMPSIGFSPMSSDYINFSYQFQDKHFFTNDDRSADQHGFQIDNYLFFFDNQAYATAGYRVEYENTKGAEFEYLGHYFDAGLNAKFSQYFLSPTIDLGYEYYFKDYDNITTSIGKKRNDERHSLNFGVSLKINSIMNAKLVYQHIAAISNLATSDFDENIVTLTIGADF